jgi:hypothetical protein
MEDRSVEKCTCKLYTEFLRDPKFHRELRFHSVRYFFLVGVAAKLVSFGLFLYVNLGLCCFGFDWRGFRCWALWSWVGFLDLSSKYSADDEGEEYYRIKYRI